MEVRAVEISAGMGSGGAGFPKHRPGGASHGGLRCLPTTAAAWGSITFGDRNGMAAIFPRRGARAPSDRAVVGSGTPLRVGRGVGGSNTPAGGARPFPRCKASQSRSPVGERLAGWEALGRARWPFVSASCAGPTVRVSRPGTSRGRGASVAFVAPGCRLPSPVPRCSAARQALDSDAASPKPPPHRHRCQARGEEEGSNGPACRPLARGKGGGGLGGR